MRIAIYAVMGILLIWFIGPINKIGDKVIGESAGIKSPETIWAVLYIISCLSFIIIESVGKWILLVFVFLWIVIQFNCHWRKTIFGVPQNRVDAYNNCFKNTYHIIPMSETRVIPDFFHIVLHSILILLFVLLAVYIFI